ncbi:MAG TPA: ferritin-like domain-containing protein [Oceanobacillus sp.]|nr:ferritin-like domain-containing protein [Oceanobacillus sp.]
MELQNLNDLLLDHLKDLYDAEHQITKALPKMAKAASSPQLKTAFEKHLSETENQIRRLEQVFETMGKKATRKTCKGMKGLIEEGEEILKEDAADDVRDAGLIAAAQKVEHYEIASYGTVRAYAEMLGMNEAADLLQKTLDEEGNTDKKLTQLAESRVNVKAQ